MGRKIGIILVLAAACMALSMPAAMAAPPDSVNGQGQTPLSASMGFNADADLAGQLTYNSDPQGQTPEFWAQCDDFDSFNLNTRVNPHGHTIQSVKLTATCTDGDGITVYMLGSFTDRGEPGSLDSICVIWKYGSPPVKNDPDPYIHDRGFIANGNIQIHDH